MKNEIGKKTLKLLLILLLIGNIFFYFKYKTEKAKNDFISPMISHISKSHKNYLEPLVNYSPL